MYSPVRAFLNLAVFKIQYAAFYGIVAAIFPAQCLLFHDHSAHVCLAAGLCVSRRCRITVMALLSHNRSK